jgi:rubrerythrin
MPHQTPIDILKEAILLERRGHAFYNKVAEQSDDPDLKAFFRTMAQEEVRHIEILEGQFAAYAQNRQFLPIPEEDRKASPVAPSVLTREVQEKMTAANFEAAAISAAMLMEEKAVALYSHRADATRDPAEEALYRWLADWERSHLSFLAQLDKELREAIWNDNQFWPF